MPPPPIKTVYNNFSEKVYGRSAYIGIVEILQYVMFIVIVYWFNPFSIATTYPVFTNFLTLLVSLVYVLLFYFLSDKIILNRPNPTENDFLIKLLGTIGVFVGSILFIKYLGNFIVKDGSDSSRYCVILLSSQLSSWPWPASIRY